MKLLLHTCCAPCEIYPFEKLKEKGFETTAFFYNPNIHPFTEYKNRKEAVESFSSVSGINVIYPQYCPQEFFQAVNLKEDRPKRCLICWSLRLRATAKAAKEKGYNYFSTTLLASPYQNQEELNKIGNDIAKTDAISFYYEDFRPGFRYAHEIAKERGIYCQKYCGCIYSEIERYKK